MNFDTREIDLQYEPFPEIENWENLVVDQNRAERYNSVLEELKNHQKEVFLRSQNIVKRIAAIETGSVEGLYETDRGFTFTVALQTASWEALFNAKGKEATSLINDQLSAYDFVLDFATKKTPISPAWIRQLHEVICSSQAKYKVYTNQGWQNQKLPKGKYKVLPNHVLDRNDEIHAYSPVEMVPSEMQRFCDILNGETFQKLHPLIQAAYVHYILVYIHPFADGNGRVARALASVYTYRSYSVPILIFADEREEYYLSLSESDNQEYQRFVTFISEKTFDAILIVKDSIQNALEDDTDDVVREIESLYVTSSGFSQQDIDNLAQSFITEITKEFQKGINASLTSEVLSLKLSTSPSSVQAHVVDSSYRLLMKHNQTTINVNAKTKPPASVNRSISFQIIVPKDCGANDDIILFNAQTNQKCLEVRPKEIDGAISTQTQIRIKMFVERELNRFVSEVYEQARKVIKGI